MDLMVAVICLALNIYHEARGEPIEGQYAVAQTTMNRAGYDRRKVCEVVTADRQFSWTIEGVWWMHDKPYLSPRYRPADLDAWKIAVRVARISMVRGKIDVVGDARFFHAVSIRPDWVPHVEFVKTIGGHRFYRGDGKIRQTPAAVPTVFLPGRVILASDDMPQID